MKKNALHNIKKPGFKIPDNYFDGLEDSVMNQIKLKNKIVDSGFKTPDSYFDALDGKILTRTKQEPKVIKFFSKRNLIYVTSIAAVFVLMFNIFWANKPSSTELEVADIAQYLLQQEDISDYELASLLTEYDLTTDNFIDSQIPEEHLEKYLLENTTLEDLIID